MIVKHETRIRTLETKNKEQEKQLMSQVVLNSLVAPSSVYEPFFVFDPTVCFCLCPLHTFCHFISHHCSCMNINYIFTQFQGIHLNNNGHSGEDLDPDEV